MVQRVKQGNYLQYQMIALGIPQGSVLRPLLVVDSMNTLVDKPSNGGTYLVTNKAN